MICILIFVVNDVFVLFFSCKQELDKTKSYVKNLLSTMKPFTNEWQSELEELQKGVVTLPHDCLLMAASIVYLGVHSKLHQDKVKQIWLSSTSLENSSHFTLATILSTEDEQNKWARQINVENPALVENLLGIRSISQASKKCWPLLIDPNDEAEKYVNLVEKVMASGINSTTTNTTKNSTSSTNNITGTTTPPTEHAPHSNGDQRIIVIDASHKALGKISLRICGLIFCLQPFLTCIIDNSIFSYYLITSFAVYLIFTK